MIFEDPVHVGQKIFIHNNHFRILWCRRSRLGEITISGIFFCTEHTETEWFLYSMLGKTEEAAHSWMQIRGALHFSISGNPLVAPQWEALIKIRSEHHVIQITSKYCLQPSWALNSLGRGGYETISLWQVFLWLPNYTGIIHLNKHLGKRQGW